MTNREHELVIENENILPVQFALGPHVSWVQWIYAASFEDAIALLQRGALLGQNPAVNYRIQQQAYEQILWVLWEQDFWSFSFARHCLVLGLDEKQIRAAFVKLYHRYFGPEIVPPHRPSVTRAERRRIAGLQKEAA